MSDQYIGEIRMFGGNFAPQGWALCDGQLLNIQQNDILYSLIGTTYGGDGVTNFALPDLRGRIPLGFSPAFPLGQKGGYENVTLLEGNLPAHTHVVAAASGNGTTGNPEGALWALCANQFALPPANAAMSTQAIGPAGGGQPHNNMMPSLTINFIIALEGLYPNRQ